MKVYSGKDAGNLEKEVRKERVLESRFVYTSDDGSNEGILKARWCVRVFGPRRVGCANGVSNFEQ